MTCLVLKKSSSSKLELSYLPPTGQSAAVFAGKPGRARKTAASTGQSGVVEDWHRCVKHLSVSSRESQAHRLIDGTAGCWQSSGSQGKHWIRLEMQADILVKRLYMRVEPSDSSYMPSLVVVSAGDSINNMKELKTINIGPTDTLVTLLQDLSEVQSL